MPRKHWAMYSLFGKMSRTTLRYLVIGGSFFGLLLYGVFTNSMMSRLRMYSRATTETHAQLISEALFDKMGDMAERMILRQIPSDFDMPIIITDMLGRPQIWENIYVGHFFWKRKVSHDDASFATRQLLTQQAQKMARKYKPKLIYGSNKKTHMGMLYYGESNFISGLSQMPFYEIGFVLFFIISVYYVINSMQKTEKGNIWVGLAKETAHQLGTPLTSLFGWIEYLRLESESMEDDDFGFGADEDEFRHKVMDVVGDMSRDVKRLQKVTNRFSQIGSMPVMERSNVKLLLDEHLAYFSKRLPTLGKKVAISFDSEELPDTDLNYDLLSWVFENLFKNALDALDKTIGEIRINAKYISVDKLIRITHRDNGKGISWDNRNAVFNPGFSTKQRGWGLGLTLARRIVEEYHHGRIYISWSQKGKGTEFTVEIPVPETGSNANGDAA
jgi:hypothetical protein